MPSTIQAMATTTAAPRRGLAQTTPPEAFFVVSAIFHYLGPAFAVLLFARVDVLGVAWLRIASAAVIFALWRRPWRSVRGSGTTRLLLAWGAVLALMNSTFYLAIDRLPLGTRTPRNMGALALAIPGVYLLTDVALEGDPLGVVFAFINAGLFAAYIMVSHRAAQNGSVPGIDLLGMAMLIAAVVATPIGAWAAVPAFGDPVAIAAGIGVGVSSSVIPYVTDQLAMARMSRSTYALMVALLPATATVIGIVVLAQLPSAVEAAGVALVIVGVGLHRDADAA